MSKKSLKSCWQRGMSASTYRCLQFVSQAHGCAEAVGNSEASKRAGGKRSAACGGTATRSHEGTNAGIVCVPDMLPNLQYEEHLLEVTKKAGTGMGPDNAQVDVYRRKLVVQKASVRSVRLFRTNCSCFAARV